MTSIEFVHRLGGQATIALTGQTGEVRGLSIDIDGVAVALLRYVDGKGDVASDWIRETDLAPGAVAGGPS